MKQGEGGDTTDSDHKVHLVHRKEVHFAPTSQLDLISTPLTKEESRAAWYDQRDFEEFKRLNRCIGKTIRDRRSLFESFVETLDPLTTEQFESPIDEDVTRGIEHFCCAEYFVDRKIKKRQVVQAVLAEQEKQRRTNINDVEAIAEVERRLARPNLELASKLGTLDAMFSKNDSWIERIGRKWAAMKPRKIKAEKVDKCVSLSAHMSLRCFAENNLHRCSTFPAGRISNRGVFRIAAM